MIINALQNTCRSLNYKPFQPAVFLNTNNCEADTFVKSSNIGFKASNGVKFYEDKAKAREFFDQTKNLTGMQPICDIFAGYLTANAKPADIHILDAGCGSGRDSKYFLSKGFKVTAIDGSEELCRLASDFIGQKVQHLEYSQLPNDTKYNGIWANSALVHMQSDEELHKSIDSLSKAIKDDGFLYTSFKHGDKTITDGKGRIQRYFNEKTLSDMFSQHPELEIQKMWVTKDTMNRPDNDWLSVILKKSSTK